MLGFVRGGDTVIVHSMDRLARNLEDLRCIVRELTATGVRVQFVKEQLTFTGEDTAMATLGGCNRTLRVLVDEAGLSNRMFRTVVKLSGRDMRRRNFLLGSAFSAAAIS